mmetsp:Transcript_7108/g.10364  ORF Transcript_7108/g.10364 Transcript_7108/m.10364 type:complete len:781 (+) Transcript_7108:67-2409(+)|eukprot:CAMPEP_0194210456 /NCGR_PEP_ID=MMETSP0156-20130528/8518_1 /TAXON_ID=33649 /ORGANISM="Thalassionema nitzschioides, Strain L26-B" /LENGTH=780 /DNA_ID=CAMNT_0038937805 /DNA_START=67 /DNA_END=2409 /DNA_ORIENTATION=+
MPAFASYPLPIGSIGLAFSGKDVPVVSSIAPDSPMMGLVEIGYTFVSLTLGTGVCYEGLSTKELAQYLVNKAEDHERVLKLEMTMPSYILLEGRGSDFSSLVVEERNMKPTVVGFDSSSPLKKMGARMGMVVSSVELSDGCKIVGAAADEITEILSSESIKSIELIGADEDMPRRLMRLPKFQIVDIPKGSTYDLGLDLQENPAQVMKSAGGIGVREGMVVESLSLVEGHIFHKLGAGMLADLLDSTAGSSDRRLSLVHASLMQKNCSPFAEVSLPQEEVGLALSGSPAMIRNVRPSSVLSNLGLEGAVVRNIKFPDGPSFYELSAADLADLMQESEGIEGRTINARLAQDDDVDDTPTYDNETPSSKYDEMPSVDEDTADSEQSDSIEPVVDEDTDPYMNTEGHLDIVLEAGKLHCAFAGQPPTLTKISPKSALYGKVDVGRKVHTLTLVGGAQYYDISTVELTNALKASESQERRVLTFFKEDNDDDDDDAPDSDGENSYIDVELPTGRLGISFRGKNAPAVVYKVQDDSPLPQKIKDMCVDTLSAGGAEKIQLNAREVTDIIKATTDMPGRVIRVRDPDSQNFKTLSEVVEIPVQPGSLGVSFGGDPPVIRSFKPGSQLEDKVPPGYYLDSIKNPADGYCQSGMTTKEAVGLLGFLNEQERVLVFKNKTMAPSPKEEIFPENKIVTLPVGKLGISFRGKTVARISRLHEESKLRGLVYISMEVVKISIPGGSKFKGLGAADCAKVLADTKNTEGRILELRAPSADGVSTAGGESARN